MSPSVHQTSYDLMCQLLRRVLRDAVHAGPRGADGISSVECQAVATLYMLLMEHPIDRRGRCRSCRRPGAAFGSRRRRCRVYGKASVWLHQPDEALLRCLLVRELELAAAPPPATGVAPGPASASDPLLLAGGMTMLTAGFVRAAWPDLRLPLATVEPEQCGDREPETTADGAPDAN